MRCRRVFGLLGAVWACALLVGATACAAAPAPETSAAAPSANAAPGAPGGSLDSLTQLKSAVIHRLSSYDRTGGNGDGLHSAPIQPGETREIGRIDSPGEIVHFWCTLSSREMGHLRKIVLRMYWDGEDTPSVEVPLGDFFAQCHGLYYDVDSIPIATANSQAMNAYWRMPFSKQARITITNDGVKEIRRFFFNIEYYTGDGVVNTKARFHAQYRQAFPTTSKDNYVILDAKGKGQYVGTILAVQVMQPQWWGEGDEMIYIDGSETPQVHGTGTEDYFCGAWCYPRPEPFCRPYFGCPLRGEAGPGGRWCVYRFHVQDPIPFEQSIRFTMEHGDANDRQDNWSSVAFWYQEEPHAPFPPLPPVADRLVWQVK